MYKNKYKTKSNRLQFYDYGSDGAYFITICTVKHLIEFGEIINSEMILNKFGEIVKTEWLKTEKMRKNVSLGEFCVMPNHFHAILFFGEPILLFNDNRLPHTPNYKNSFGKQKNNLASLIAGFKSTCTKQITDTGNKSFAWQSNYYDHIVRNKRELKIIENYIRSNPRNWENDKFFTP
ncbi:MAG: hypothetical protein L3J56_01970 [Bacteroidales bacterium]|nr:hypothetical protein [Bacteroidales bacterium]